MPEGMMAFISGMIMLGMGSFIGFDMGVNDERKRLVEEGIAEYFLDEKWERQWRLKLPTPSARG